MNSRARIGILVCRLQIGEFCFLVRDVMLLRCPRLIACVVILDRFVLMMLVICNVRLTGLPCDTVSTDTILFVHNSSACHCVSVCVNTYIRGH